MVTECDKCDKDNVDGAEDSANDTDGEAGGNADDEAGGDADRDAALVLEQVLGPGPIT